MKTVIVLSAVLATSAALGANYKWTGAVSSDFADAGNWLKDEGGAWVATETPPANEYNTDDIYFDGVAAECPNMPVLSTRWKLHRVYFLTGGWTISATTVDGATGDLQLVKGYGGTGGTGDYRGVVDDTAIFADNTDGLVNEISCRLYQPAGLRVSVAEGAKLVLSGKIDIVSGDSGLGSQSQRMGFFGGGDLVIAGSVSNAKLARYLEMSSGRLYLANTSGRAVQGNLDVKGGQVIVQGDDQFGEGSLFLSGDASIDFGGYKFAPGGDFFFGGKYNGTPLAWTGSISGTENIRTTSNDKGIVVTPLSKQVILIDFPGPAGWKKNSDNRKIRVGDIPGVDEELVLNGPLFNNTKGNYGGSVYFNGWEDDGTTTYGSVSLNAATGFGGIYTRAFVSTTLYVNGTTEGTSALGNPLTIKVNPSTGVLRGDGVVTPYAGDAEKAPAVNVYGTLAPGSVANPSGTLAFQRSGTKVDIMVTMYTNSIFRVEADESGACPKVVQNDGTLTLQTAESVRAALEAQNAAIAEANAALEEGDTPAELIDIEAAMVGVASPKIVIGGDYAPSHGWHRVLTVKGTLVGSFGGVEAEGFPYADRYTTAMRTVVDEATGETHIEIKAAKSGMAVLLK